MNGGAGVGLGSVLVRELFQCDLLSAGREQVSPEPPDAKEPSGLVVGACVSTLYSTPCLMSPQAQGRQRSALPRILLGPAAAWP